MAREVGAEKVSHLCEGGRSYNRKKHEHEKGTQINCYRCGAIMGCGLCCEALAELICLPCNNWASRQGVEKHGDVVPNDKIQHVHTDRGWKHWDRQKDARGDVIEMVKEVSKRRDAEKDEHRCHAPASRGEKS